MNIILLSGGSGKRLWPLSNDVRSKQFVQLFKNESGYYESMVQRVYRQIRSVDPKSKITIATSKSQVSAIKNQLDDQVFLCVEPCRKDTFPAIALAAADLKYNCGLDDSECIIVCPVDPFVDESFFDSFHKLEKLVLDGMSNLFLMGINPSCPSEKYGYIIPFTQDSVSKVREFKEKPDAKTAADYISQGALWNAGVFAFRLGYIMEKAHLLLDFTDYQDLYSKYDQLSRISFDYAVAEKEESVCVMRYSGSWRDIGTWNTLADVIDPIKGNVTVDETCEDVTVVNELDLPVLCLGCQNMIVAVGRDGILVSDKEKSAHLKSYVDRINNEVQYAEKSWGTYTVLDMQPGSAIIKIELTAKKSMKYHSHGLRNESWNILSGEGIVLLDGEERPVRQGDFISIPANSKHMLTAKTDMTVIEIQTGSAIEKSDKVVYPL